MKKLLALLCAVTLLLGLAAPALAVGYGAELNPNKKTYEQTFKDVPKDHWCFEMIEELVERGAINGYPDGNFYPNNIVTRQEFAKIMVVAAGEAVHPANNVSFEDVPLDHWANPFIEAAKPYMTAYVVDTQGTQAFKPEAGALREDMAVAVVKLRGYDTRLADLSMLNTMFSDVDSISASARPYVALAVENGVISGYLGENGGKGTFGGQRTITRCEAAAILWRAFQYGNDNKVIAAETSAKPTAAAKSTATSKPTSTAKPSASPKPSASAKPTASPKPSPTPTLPPEPTEAPKPFVAETMVKNVKISDTKTMMTMDDDSNLIFYNESADQIVSLDPDTDRTRVLLDVGSATCEMPVEGEAASLSAVEDEETAGEDADIQDGGVSDDDDTQPPEESGEPEPAPPATITYEDLTVKQVFWDDVAGRLLVVGEFAKVQSRQDDGWNTPNKDDSLSGVFVLDNGEMTWLAKYKDFKKIYCALSDGTFVTGYGHHNSFSIFDLSSNSYITTLTYNDYDYTVFQYGDGIYRAGAYGYYDVDKYDYGTGSWEQIASNVIVSANIYANDVIYTWRSSLIQAIRPTDGATQDKLDPSTDVDIQDLRPLPTSPSNLRVTSDEQYLFYDGSASAIRVIRPNPKA